MSIARIRLRRGTTEQWTQANPVLAEGEPGIDTTLDQFKIGDGVAVWTDLPWQSYNVETITQALSDIDAGLVSMDDKLLLMQTIEAENTDYTDAREAAIRTDLTTGDADTLAAAKAYSDSHGIFRGIWSTSAAGKVYDFSSGTIPAEFTKSHDATYGIDPTVSATSNAGQTGPPPYANSLRLRPQNANNGAYSRATLVLSATGVTGIVGVRFWLAKQDTGYLNTWQGSKVQKNGVDTFNSTAASIPWQQQTITATGADTILWQGDGRQAINAGTANDTYVTGIEILVSAAPYMRDQIVISGGNFYRSTADTNTSVPGAAGAAWELVETGLTAAKAYADTKKAEAIAAVDKTTTKGDLLVRDATGLVRQAVGPDGSTLTADSTQASGVKWSTGPASTTLSIVASQFSQGNHTVPAGIVATDYAIIVQGNSNGSAPSGFTLLGDKSGGAVYGNNLNLSYRTGLVTGNTVTTTGAPYGIMYVRNMTGPPTGLVLTENTNGAMPALPARTLNLGEMQATFISQTGGPSNPGAPVAPGGWTMLGTFQETSNNFFRVSIATSSAGAGGTFTMGNTGVGRSYTVTLPGQLAADSPYNLYQMKDVNTGSPTDGNALVWDAAAGTWKPGLVSRAGAAADLKNQIPTSSTQTAAYTFVASDAGSVVVYNAAAGANLTLNTGVFSVGDVFEVEQYGAGQATIVAGAGVTLRAPDGAKTPKQYGSVRIRCRAANEFIVEGGAT